MRDEVIAWYTYASKSNHWFSIPSNVTRKNDTYEITLKITNFIGQSASATRTLRVITDDNPIVLITGGNRRV